MASRSVWTGAIPLGPMLTLSVEALKATDKYEGSDPLKQVTECHHEPFRRTEACPTCEAHRLTEDSIKQGNLAGGTRMVMAAESQPGVFVPVDKETLEGISQSISSDVIEPLSMEARSEAPLDTASDLYYLRPAKKIAGSLDAVAAFAAWLHARDKVMLCKWSSRGRQRLVAIEADGRALKMVNLRYSQEIREPDDEVLAVMRATVPDKALVMLDQIIDLPDNLNLAEIEDESVALKQEAIAAALAGKPLPTVATTAPEASPVQDLMAQLEAAAAATPSKPAPKTTSKREKVKA